MNIDDVTIVQFVGQYFWPLVRLTAFFLAAPIFGTQVISARVRLVLGFAMALLVVPLLPEPPGVPALSLGTLLITLQQVVIGLTLGFVFQLVFQVFILSGQFLAMKMGLGFAQMNDPASGVSVTIISQFYQLAVTLLFLSINGHLILIEILVESFNSMPIGMSGFSFSQYRDIAMQGGWMFASALTLALPVLFSLLIVNIAFGIISKAAPQINIFAVGFPFTLVFGLFLVWIGFSEFYHAFEVNVSYGFDFMQRLLVVN